MNAFRSSFCKKCILMLGNKSLHKAPASARRYAFLQPALSNISGHSYNESTSHYLHHTLQAKNCTLFKSCHLSCSLQSPTNLLILSLAVSDFLVGLLLIPAEILLTDSCWFLGSTLCALYYMTDFTITSSSIGSIMLISIDRYLAICDPLHYNTKVTVNRVRFCVCACCSCYGECILVVSHVTGNVDLICTFIGPITVIVVLYVRIFMVVVSQARSMQSKIVALQQTVTMSAIKSELKAARTLGIVILVFIACLCPYYIPSFTGEDIEERNSTTFIVSWLWLLNSCVNPFVYASFYPWFRKTIKCMFSILCSCHI
uniref:G-protein coupled receptors family 1 profile domain-containing protein n=1 Tax=Periophthalmus magnuspinnatus TaxID=409849 RepID=A0A3B4AT98_9GOBI